MGWLELFCFAIPLSGFDALPVSAEGWQSTKGCPVMQTRTARNLLIPLSLVALAAPERAVAWLRGEGVYGRESWQGLRRCLAVTRGESHG